MTPPWQSRDLDAIYRPDRKWGPDFVSQVLYALLTSLLTSRDLSTNYRPDRKWGPYFVSQVLYGVLTTNFVRFARMTKDLHPWHHHGGHVAWVQFTYKIENEGQIWYLKFYVHFCQIFKVVTIKEIVNSCWG